MGWSKSCRSERCRRTRPPRPVHGEQRLLQRSVTTGVMHITDYPTVISALDFSVPCMTRTAFPAGSTACRVGASDRRTDGGLPATWTGLVAPVPDVTNGRSRAECGSVRRPWNTVDAHCRVDPERCGRRARGDGADCDGTVITLKRQSRHPQGLGPTTYPGTCWSTSVRPSGSGTRRRPGTTSAPAVGARRCHQFQLRTMRSFLSSGPVRSGRRSGSPVPVAHCGSFRSKGLFAASGLTSSSCALPFLPVAGRFAASAFPGSGCAPRRPSARWGRWVAVTSSSCASLPPLLGLLFWVGSSGKRAGRTSWRFGTTSRGRRHASTAPAWAGRVRRLPRYG